MAEDERDYKADPGTRSEKEQSGNSGPPPR
jgi:hypothetical protein